MVSVWDEPLVRHGEYITSRREEFLLQFLPIFGEYYRSIVGSDETVAIEYVHVGEPLVQQLQDCRQADKYSQYTNAGPHKDDFLFLLDPKSEGQAAFPLKRFGSQGQQKSFALALKLAQFQYMYERLGQKPILLLDDIFDKLDLPRIKQLIALVGSERFGQVLLTDTQPGRVQAIFDELPHLEHRLFEVKKGNVYELGR